jgi:beta-glucanase (GH16 family)
MLASPCRNIGTLTSWMIGDPSRDEIDIELLGGDPEHWQTNVFGPSEQDPSPHYGRFNEIQKFPQSGTIEAKHSYTIDWNRDRIIWSVDGKVERTLERGTVQHSHTESVFADIIPNVEDTKIKGVPHFPSHTAHLQLGIWDASSQAGTAKWAKGPIDWSQTPSQVAAVIRSVTVECPHS